MSPEGHRNGDVVEIAKVTRLSLSSNFDAVENNPM